MVQSVLKLLCVAGRMTAKPENEDVQRAAKAANVSYETVYEAAMNARK